MEDIYLAKLKRYRRAVLLIIIAAFVGSMLYSEYGYFAFSATYTDLKSWYPRYYHVIYIALCIIRVMFVLLVAMLLWRYKHLFPKISAHIRNLYLTWRDAEAIASADTHLSPIQLKYTNRFFVAHVLLFILSLLTYFILPDIIDLKNAQLYITKLYVLLAIILTVDYAITNHKPLTNGIFNFFFKPSSAFNLSIYRILFFTLLIFEYKSYITNSLPFIESKPREALPFIGWLINIMPISKEMYLYAAYLGIATCVLIIIGLFTRFALIINALLVFYIISVPNFYGKLWHSQLSIWISWFLLFTPLNGRFALDNYLFPKTRNDTLSPNHTFPLRIIWLQIGILYFWAGYHKLCSAGFDWAFSQSMVNQVRLEWFEHYDALPFFRIDLYPWLLHMGGILAILFELTYPFLLFHSRLRYISIMGGIIMHNIIDAFMYIGFQKLQYQYVVFINYETIFSYIRTLLYKKHSTIQSPPIDMRLNKTVLYVSLFIFFSNMLCGLLKVNSFPFSVYPTYTEIVEAEKSYLLYNVIDAGKQNINVHDLGKKSHFRWENFSRIDYAITQAYIEEKKTDTMAIINHWKWWAAAIDTLKSVDTLDVYLVRRSINPDSADIILNKQYLIRIYPNQTK